MKPWFDQHTGMSYGSICVVRNRTIRRDVDTCTERMTAVTTGQIAG